MGFLHAIVQQGLVLLVLKGLGSEYRYQNKLWVWGLGLKV